MKILHIDSSILGEHSASRRLSAAVVERLRDAAPGASVVYRDVAAHPVPQVTAALVQAAAVPSDERDPALAHDAAVRSAVVDEVLSADVIVIGTPMYNFAIPSQLKSWIDAMTVPGKTFQYTAAGPKGLLGDKRVVIVSTRGGLYGADSPMAAFEHQETYLRSLLGFLGVTRFDVVRAEGLKVSDAARDAALQAALAAASELAIA